MPPILAALLLSLLLSQAAMSYPLGLDDGAPPSANFTVPMEDRADRIDPKRLEETAVPTFAEEFNSFRTWDGIAGWETNWASAGPAGGGGLRNELHWFPRPTFPKTMALRPWDLHGEGMLALTARKTPPALLSFVGERPYVSGMIHSGRTHAQLYGYYEIRAKFPGGPGLLSGFFLMPQRANPQAEIDVVISSGKGAISSAVHARDANGSVRSDVSAAASLDTAEFHRYGVDWQPDVIRFFIDGVEHYRARSPDIDTPMYLAVTLAVGGDLAGAPAAETQFPQRLIIDYLRAYRVRTDAERPKLPEVATLDAVTAELASLNAALDEIEALSGAPKGERPTQLPTPARGKRAARR